MPKNWKLTLETVLVSEDLADQPDLAESYVGLVDAMEHLLEYWTENNLIDAVHEAAERE